ncbi:hypothetical protein ANCCEY_03388 [Ancylostoma ceylanicum]|uniref:Glycosyl hydrolase family 25 n=1 Tax=Ancylostoma ceylanicum TaxID=53326 RepID=A0A0D6M564_9BILA|nr:hypothetical protein ANCCEY_03388 [Ancylostoma ceylanicum]
MQRAYSPAGQGQLDPNACNNIKNAYAATAHLAPAGLNTEAYMTPVPKSSKTGAQQFDEMYGGLRNCFISVLSIWIQQYGIDVAVYTNVYEWNQITGGATITNVQLWYWNAYGAGATKESPADYDDFRSFGGWTTPSAKQFGQVEFVCGVTLNRDIISVSNSAESIEMEKHEKSEQIVVGTLGRGSVVSGQAEIKQMQISVVICSLALSCFASPVTEQQGASATANLVYAVDVNVPVSVTQFQCIRNSSYNVAFISAYSTAGQGQPDWHAPINIQNANAAGLKSEVYMRPQPRSTKTGVQQFDEMYGGLRNNNINIKTIWIQMTSLTNWYSNTTYNLNFINGILTRASVHMLGRLKNKQYNLNIGIYTSRYEWNVITDGGEAENMMLWYWNVYGNGPANESPANFNDFIPFGGWASPSAKQFGQSESVCGVTVNRDIYSLSIPTNVARTDTHKKHDQIVVGSLGVGRATSGKAQIRK